MTGTHVVGLVAFALLLTAGVLLWRSYGTLVWLDSAISYCF